MTGSRAGGPAPLCIDLFCGFGGWARGFLDAGYRVQGFDIEPKCADHYPGEFRLADVATLDGRDYQGARVIVASPPCTWFSIARTNRNGGRDPDRGMALVREAKRVIDEADPDFWVIENVRGAYRAISSELGPPIHRGLRNQSHYLWGRIPPTIIPRIPKRAERYSGQDRAWTRSLIPYPLAKTIAEACKP